MCNFRDPNLVAFYFYELTHFLDWMKSTLLFICSTNILVPLLTINMENCLTPKTPKMCDPIIVNPVVNGTPSSGTSPLASYTEVPAPPPPPDLVLKTVTQQMQKESCHMRTSFKGWNWWQLARVSLENEESDPKNYSQLYNSNFIWSEIKLNKYVLFKKCNQIIDTWN